MKNSIYEYKVLKRDNTYLDLNSLKGKVLLIVNTATGCGFTPQYDGLESLYKKYKDKGLEILDFPCDQFGHQAPGTDDEIHTFCTSKYNTSFDQLKKIEVNGTNEEPLYTYLKSKIDSKNKAINLVFNLMNHAKNKNDIKWNFTKFLVDKNGKVVNRFEPTTKPEEIEKFIKELINE